MSIQDMKREISVKAGDTIAVNYFRSINVYYEAPLLEGQRVIAIWVDMYRLAQLGEEAPIPLARVLVFENSYVPKIEDGKAKIYFKLPLKSETYDTKVQLSGYMYPITEYKNEFDVVIHVYKSPMPHSNITFKIVVSPILPEAEAPQIRDEILSTPNQIQQPSPIGFESIDKNAPPLPASTSSPFSPTDSMVTEGNIEVSGANVPIDYTPLILAGAGITIAGLIYYYWIR